MIWMWSYNGTVLDQRLPWEALENKRNRIEGSGVLVKKIHHRSAACEFFSWKAPGIVEETGNI